MEFGFTAEQEMLRKSFSEFLSRECSPDRVKQWWADETGYSAGIWKKMVRLGWIDLIFEQGKNGEKTNHMDLFILFEEIGRVLLPSPLFASAVMAGMILKAAGEEDHGDTDLAAVIEGRRVFTAGLMNEAGRYDHKRPGITAKVSGAGRYCLNGVRFFVPYAGGADVLLVCADVSGDQKSGPTIFRIDKSTPGVVVEPMDTIYPEQKCRVLLKDVQLPGAAVVGEMGKGHGYIEKMMDPAIVLKCAEMLGGMKYVFDVTAEHAKNRHQFGKPLGVLQAVQHLCADMATLYEGARLIAYQAASLMDEGVLCKKEISMAKAWVGDAYRKCTWIGHQIHGGIGFTEEYALHLYYKHAKENELMFGDARFHRAQIISQMGL